MEPTGNPRSVFFHHVPKCAGSTLTQYLAGHYPANRWFRASHEHPDKSIEEFCTLPERARHSFRLITGHGVHAMVDAIDPNSLRVTVLRDPVDRIISHYFYAKRTEGMYLHKDVVEKNLSLGDYATSGIEELTNYLVTSFCGSNMTDVERHPENSVQRAYTVVSERYDIIIFQDDFECGVRDLAERAGLWRQLPEERANAAPERPTVDQSARDVIAEINALDVKLYDLLRAKFKPAAQQA